MITAAEELYTYIQCDLWAQGLSRWRPHYRITKRVTYFEWLLRRCEYWTNCRADPVGRAVSAFLRLRLHFLAERLGFTIPLNTFREGLSIAHPGTIVVNRGVQVGPFCRIHQGVTLGQIKGRNPTLGARVFLGANACVLGHVHVHDDVAIGAGAVVLKDVPTGVTVAGAPARIVATSGSASHLLCPRIDEAFELRPLNRRKAPHA